MVGEIAEAATILPNQFGVHFLGVNRSEGAPVMKVIPRYRGESYPGAMYSRHYARLAENGWVVSGSEEMQEEFVLYFGRADAMLE